MFEKLKRLLQWLNGDTVEVVIFTHPDLPKWPGLVGLASKENQVRSNALFSLTSCYNYDWDWFKGVRKVYKTMIRSEYEALPDAGL